MKTINFLTFDVELTGTNAYNEAYKEYQDRSKDMGVSIWYPKYQPETEYRIIPKEILDLGYIQSIDSRHIYFKVDDTFYISDDISRFTPSERDKFYGYGHVRTINVKDGAWSVDIEAGEKCRALRAKSKVVGEGLRSSYTFESFGDFETVLLLSDKEISFSTKDKAQFENKLTELKKIADTEINKLEFYNRYCNLVTELCGGKIKKVGKLKVDVISYGNSVYKLNLSYRGIIVFTADWDGGYGELSYGFKHKGKWEEDLLDNFDVAYAEYKEKQRLAEEKESNRIKNILSNY